MKVEFKHDAIEIEVESLMDSHHEIEKKYLNSFDNPEVERENDSRGNTMRLTIRNKPKQ